MATIAIRSPYSTTSWPLSSDSSLSNAFPTMDPRRHFSGKIRRVHHSVPTSGLRSGQFILGNGLICSDNQQVLNRLVTTLHHARARLLSHGRRSTGSTLIEGFADDS